MVDETAARILHEALARGALNRTGSSLEDKFQDDKYVSALIPIRLYRTVRMGTVHSRFQKHSVGYLHSSCN